MIDVKKNVYAVVLWKPYAYMMFQDKNMQNGFNALLYIDRG